MILCSHIYDTIIIYFETDMDLVSEVKLLY